MNIVSSISGYQQACTALEIAKQNNWPTGKVYYGFSDDYNETEYLEESTKHMIEVCLIGRRQTFHVWH